MTTPPRLARRLLLLLTPPSLRDVVDGDLREAFQDRCQRSGPARARLWYWRQLASPDVLRLALGRPGRVRLRESHSWRDGVGRDARFAVRALRRQPVFTLVVLLTLGVGVGANAAVLSVVRSVLLTPLPFPESNRLVMVFRTVPRFGLQRSTTSYPDFHDWRAGIRAIMQLAAYAPVSHTTSTPDGAERWTGYRATADLGTVLGVSPAIGRWFSGAEDRPGAPRVVVLSHALWQSRFGEDPGIAGRFVTLDDEPYLIVGVMPPGFGFPSDAAQFWVPMRGDAGVMERDANFLVVIGRLGHGVSVSRAQVDLAALAARIDAEAPGANEGYGVLVETRHAFVVRDADLALRVFAGAVVLVLLIACANVATLLVTRAAARARELAVRAALGAGRWRNGRLLVTESAVLGLAGGLLGCLAAAALVNLFVFLGAGQVPRLEETRLDGMMLGFALLLALGCGMGVGLIGAWTGGRGSVLSGLRDTARGAVGRMGRRLQRGFVILQVAVAVVLSVGAGLLVNSFIRLTGVEPGFEPADLMTARLERPLIGPEGPGAIAAARARIAFFERVRDRAAATGGIEGATLAYDLPFGRHAYSRLVRVEGRGDPESEPPAIPGNVVGADYFSTMGIPLQRGRSFESGDQGTAPPVTVISQAMADAFWPGTDPLGKRIRIGNGETPWVTVVGVVGDVRQRTLADPPAPTFYRPVTQVLWPDAMFVIVRSRAMPAAVAALRRIVREEDPSVPLTDIAAPTALIERTTRAPRFRAAVLLLFGLAALVVAVAGVYGVMASSVHARKRELGIRVALGARPQKLVAGVLGEGVVLAAIGLGVGVAVTGVFARVLGSMLYGLQSYDPPTYLAVLTAVMTVSAIASYVPARRAAASDPLESIRAD